MSPMVLFEAVWLESPASQSSLAKVEEGFGRFSLQPLKAPRPWQLLEAPGSGPCFRVWDPDSPEGTWERSWEAFLEALGKAHLQPAKKHEAPPEQMDHTLGVLI